MKIKILQPVSGYLRWIPLFAGGLKSTIIGRSQESSDEVVALKQVSRPHVIFVELPNTDDIYVRDLKSRNGITVNGTKVNEGTVIPEGLIGFAGAVFRYKLLDRLPDEVGKKEEPNDLTMVIDD